MRIIRKLVCMLTAAALAVGLAVKLPDASPAAEAVDAGSMSAKQISEAMGLGWNLGNTLEAHGTDSSGLATEVSWANPRATEQLIKAIRAKGFTTIRIPVTWGNHLVSGNTIDPVWFERVHEVVDIALDEGFFVILNLHHEDDWLIPDNSHYSTASTKLKALWGQIAKEFKDYDKHLIFEGMNEPRTVGSTNEWNGGTSEERAVINKLGKDFVDTVRATGGNNSTRALMIPTYAASNNYYAMRDLVLPDDSNLIVSVHAYTPYPFAMNKHSTFDTQMENQLSSFFNDLDINFLNKGIPVCIGEFGASNYNNTSDRVKWAESYAKKAVSRNLPMVIWDNNTVSDSSNPDDCFGLIDRDSLSWYSASEPLVNKLISCYGLTSTSYTPVYGDGSISITTSNWWGEKTLTKAQLLAGHNASEVASVTIKSTYRMYVAGYEDIFEYKLDADKIPASLNIGVVAPSGRKATVWWEVKLKYLKGDVNHDGVVDRIDANLLSRYVAGWDGYESRIYKDMADLNGDGAIDRIDANILSRCIADWDGYRAKYIK